MNKGIVTLILGILSFAMFSFLMEGDEQRRGREKSERVAVNEIMSAYNLKFNKDVAKTVIVFQLDPADSVQIQCDECPRYMPSEDNTKGTLDLSLETIDATKYLKTGSFDRWIKVKSSNGKIGLVFTRDGFGEKNIKIPLVKVWVKTKKPTRDEAGVPASVLDVNSVYIDRLLKDAPEDQLRFVIPMKSEDQVQVTIKGVNGVSPDNLVCNQYKQGEEFDKSPIEVGAPYPLPEVEGGKDLFHFEFSHIEGIKGVNTYHLNVDRIPAHSAGYLDEEDSVGVDSLPPVDTLIAEEPADPFLKYLKLMQGAPDFTCTTPELKIQTTVLGKLNLGPGKRNKVCYDLQLTDECVAAEDCIGCDSVWGFWLGAGNDLINRYNFKDSTRKLTTGEGLIEAWAHSVKFRGMTSSRIFPEVYYGEDIFFAIIDQAETDRFLNTDWLPEDWGGDYEYVLSPGAYMRSYPYILQYNPERPVSLCMCNNNAVTSVPVMFRFQQFLIEPRKEEKGVGTETALNEG